MARTAEKRAKEKTAAAERKVKATGKPTSGVRGSITTPVTPSSEPAEIIGNNDLPRSDVVKKSFNNPRSTISSILRPPSIRLHIRKISAVQDGAVPLALPGEEFELKLEIVPAEADLILQAAPLNDPDA